MCHEPKRVFRESVGVKVGVCAQAEQGSTSLAWREHGCVGTCT